ncbi:putative glycoside hydrolase [Thalassotalea sp. PLHSN55]|uniref:putative glycoside hydrolase n=1 Tax=Thalassotalea sp. PLHSN55 TaxID=3435888 RepID=UPI003F84D1B3
MAHKFSISGVIGASLLCLSTTIFAQTNAHVDYFVDGQSVGPWDFSLQFGKVKLENNKGKTLRGSLTAKPTSKNADNDAIRLTWKPRGIKNEWGSEDKNILTASLLNTQHVVDLSQYIDNGVLLIDMKVVKAPKKLVELTMECNWDWRCRSTFPLKNGLKKLPKNEWVSVPVPIKCFAKDNFDLSKVTTPFMVYTGGKMTIEIANIRVVSSNDNLSC